MSTRVALYTRVSTEDQAKEGFSLDAQLERLRLYAAAQGWEVAGEYVDDGHSGRTTKRPQYQRMLADRDDWDTLLVLKMDRIHRNSRNFMGMMDDLTRENKGFASVTEALDTSTAMGRFVMDIIQRIAQLESEQIGERVHVGMTQKAKTGAGHLGFRVPYGYRNVEQRLEVVPEQAALVRRFYAGYLAGDGPKELADQANDEGHTTNTGKPWTLWAVRRILQNPVYAGFLHWNEKEHVYRGDHEALVTAADWNAVQQRFYRRGRKKLRSVVQLPVASPNDETGIIEEKR
ncbi:MAG: recombinase family protein [Thermoplasmatota archaeon]